jgi:hypothetical protein
MRNGAFQKYALLAALIGAPLFMLASVNNSHRAPRGILVFGSIMLLLVFCCSLAATLLSGIAIGKGFERIDRRTRPGTFWLVVGAQIFVCCACIFAVLRGLS